MTQLTRWLDESLCSLMQDLESQLCAAGLRLTAWQITAEQRCVYKKRKP